MSASAPFEFGDCIVQPGERMTLDLPISRLSNGLPIGLPVQVIHGKKDGPVLFVSAAVHGDEIIGLEIIRRLLERPALKSIHGTLLVIPIVNGYGFLNRSRYLPDRRDLNRCFPGSAKGSLAARLAHEFTEQIIKRSDFGIDIHSAAIHRENLPQLRIAEDNDPILDMAKAFAAPVIVRSGLREGSLRATAFAENVPTVVYEAGEGLRFDEQAVRAGLAGILRVMRHIGMTEAKRIPEPKAKPFIANSSYWVRAPEGGLLRLYKGLGDSVSEGERIGTVSDVFGEFEQDIHAGQNGIVIGRASLPVVNEGDALMHIAKASTTGTAAERVDTLVTQLENANMFYEDEIV